MMDSVQYHLSKTDAQTFENLYKIHYSRLYTLAFRMTGTPENAEDVLQTSFLKAYRSFSGFRHRSSPYTWLYKIVLNTAKAQLVEWKKMPMDTYAENQNISLEEAYGHIRQFGEAEDNFITERVRETCLQMFMNCMPGKYRSVYTLRVMLHLSTKETADILEISEDAVKTSLHRARKLARDHLNGKCSLIKPGSLCECRVFAAYLSRRKRTHRLLNIDVIKRHEAEAVETFSKDMAELLAVDRLYATELVGSDFDAFKKRLKALQKKETFTLLSD